MKITYNGNTINVLTVKELYEIAKMQGKENAILAINIEEEQMNGDYYCEQVEHDDVHIVPQFRPFGWEVTEHTYPAYEINIHKPY